MDTASKGTLEDEFGTHNEDEVVKQILEKGSLVESEVCTGHLELFVTVLTLALRTRAVLAKRTSRMAVQSLTKRCHPRIPIDETRLRMYEYSKHG